MPTVDSDFSAIPAEPPNLDAPPPAGSNPSASEASQPRASEVTQPRATDPNAQWVPPAPRPSAPAQPPSLSKRPPPPRRSTLPGQGIRSTVPRPGSTSPGSISEALADAAAETLSGPAVGEASAAVPTSNAANAALSAASGSGMRRLLDDIDRKFETILTGPPVPGSGELTPQELQEAQRLFLEIASNYLNPVRDLIVEIDLGEPTKEWLAVCRPAVSSLRRAAHDMLLVELASGLAGLVTALEQSEKTPGHVIDQRSREAIKAAYDKLTEALPAAFEVKTERDRREPIIVQSLLRQVPDVRKVALDRMYAAGLTSLDMFYKARPSDIADATGIARELAERVVARFQRYKRELGSLPPAPRRSREKTQLETLTKKLEEQNNAFEASARSWSAVDEKRRIRQERAATVLEVTLLLARLGEVALVEQLERLPFQKKAEELRRYLATRTG